jgi:hypothetical protein
MEILTTQVKISNSLESNLFSQLSSWRKLLKQGHLHEFESQISACMMDLQNRINEHLLQEVGQELISELYISVRLK